MRASVAGLAVGWLALATSAQSTAECVSRDQPNPIAAVYPDLPTGTLNATMVILPIPLKIARTLIPSKWKILEKAYHALLPDFPKDKYPVLFQAAHDHGIGLYALNITVPDFSKVGFSFPFLDLLGDGYSSFAWQPAQMFPADNTVALSGAAQYGQLAIPATFDPPCDAYGALPGGGSYYRSKAVAPAANASSSPGCKDDFVDLEVRPLRHGEASPYPLDFFRNITNQPIFGNGTLCDLQIRLWNTSVGEGAFAPRFVEGGLRARLEPFTNGVYRADGVLGVQADTAFIEENLLDCRTLQGYSGSGPGD